MLEKIVESCNFLLNSFPDAQPCKTYLDSRISQETQNTFQFGFFPDSSTLSSLTSLIGDEILLDSSLLYYKRIEDCLQPRNIGYPYFRNHQLILPFKNVYGEMVGLVGRSLLSEKDRSIKEIPKYLNTKESTSFKKGKLLFGLFENKNYILEQDCVYVVEGQFDVIKATEAGFRNVVGLSCNNMSPYQFTLITRYTNNIFLLLDNDLAGDNGRKHAISKFGKFANIRNFYLPEPYKDLDEFLSSNTFESLSFTIKD